VCSPDPNRQETNEGRRHIPLLFEAALELAQHFESYSSLSSLFFVYSPSLVKKTITLNRATAATAS